MQQAVYSPHNVGSLRPRLRGLRALHLADPALSGPAGAPRDQGDSRPQRTYVPESASTQMPLLLPPQPRAPRRARRTGESRRMRAKPHRRRGKNSACICSANERRADEASRDVEAWLKCYYMRERVGETFSGTISAVVPFGIFVVLDDLLRRRPGARHRARRRVLHCSTKRCTSCAASAPGMRFRLSRSPDRAGRARRSGSADASSSGWSSPVIARHCSVCRQRTAAPKERSARRRNPRRAHGARQAEVGAHRRDVDKREKAPAAKRARGLRRQSTRGEARSLTMNAAGSVAGFHAVNARLRHAAAFHRDALC